MQVDVQQRRAGRGHAPAQRRLDVVDVVEPLRAVEIDDQMRAGAAHAVAHAEMIGAILVGFRRDQAGVFLRAVPDAPFPDRKTAF